MLFYCPRVFLTKLYRNWICRNTDKLVGVDNHFVSLNMNIDWSVMMRSDLVRSTTECRLRTEAWSSRYQQQQQLLTNRPVWSIKWKQWCSFGWTILHSSLSFFSFFFLRFDFMMITSRGWDQLHALQWESGLLLNSQAVMASLPKNKVPTGCCQNIERGWLTRSLGMPTLTIRPKMQDLWYIMKPYQSVAGVQVAPAQSRVFRRSSWLQKRNYANR